MAENNEEQPNVNWISQEQVSNVNRTAALSKADNTIDTDLVFEPDPDLILEIDIPIQSTDRSEGNLVYRKGSSSTRKATSAKSNISSSSSSLRMKSRGRPIKSHEPEPFLCVDNISPEKLQAQIKSARCSAKNERTKEKRSRTPLISTNQNLPFWASTKSPYGSPVPPRSASRFSGCRTPGSMVYVSPNQDVRRTNAHVRSPFKHAVNRPESPLDIPQAPGTDLKEMTAIATYHIGKVLAKEKVEQKKRLHGKLLKGKLKPLKLCNTEGPSIRQCRGICADARFHGATASRTLERRKQLIQAIPNVHEYLYDRPRTVESIHRTSEASSVDENRDNKEAVFDEALNTDRLSEPGTEYQEPAAPPASAATTYKTTEQPGGVTPLSRTFVTEIRSTIGSRINEEENGGSPGPKTPGQFTQDSVKTNGGQPVRPSTAGQRSSEGEGSISHRPNTAGDKSKSVRFADNVSKDGTLTTDKEIKDLKNAQIIQEQNKKNDDSKKKEPKSEKQEIIQDSCKSDKKETYRDNDKDDGGGGNKGRSGQQGGGSSGVGGNLSTSTGGTKTSEGNKEETKGTGSEGGGKKQSAISENESSVTLSVRKTVESTKDLPANLVVPSSKSVPYTKRDVIDKPVQTRQKERSSSISSTKHINTLQIHAVVQGSNICHVIGPESPHRSRSPSPNRSQQDRTSGDKMDKTNKLIRPSSANLSTRGKRSSRGSKNDEYRSSGCFYLRKSKVHFESEIRERETLFTERKAGDEIFVGLKEDRNLTFDEIEAELNAIQQEIQERQEFEELIRPASVSSSRDYISDEETTDRPCEKGSPQDTERESNKTETFRDNITDFSELLTSYRKRCMNISERCGAISSSLTTPRIYRYTPQNGRRPDSVLSKKKEVIYQKASLQYNGDENTRSQTSMAGIEADQDVNYAASEVSVADSGFSMDSSISAQKGEDRLGGFVSDSCSDVCTTDRTREEEDVKPLLEIVCNELQSVQGAIDEIKPKKESQKTEVELQVIAEAKKLSKSKQTSKEKTTPAPPFAPVCFTINARPPTGYIYYFAYGSDMNPSRLSTYIHRRVTTRFWGLLFGFNLVFNKKGCDTEAGGFANIEFNPFCSAEGCIYQITPEELELLDNCIGYPTHYEHLMVPVWMANSNDPDQYSVGQYCVPALTYIAQDKWIAKDEEKLDSSYVVSQCVKGSDILTENYRNHLESLGTGLTAQT